MKVHLLLLFALPQQRLQSLLLALHGYIHFFLGKNHSYGNTIMPQHNSLCSTVPIMLKVMIIELDMQSVVFKLQFVVLSVSLIVYRACA